MALRGSHVVMPWQRALRSPNSAGKKVHFFIVRGSGKRQGCLGRRPRAVVNGCENTEQCVQRDSTRLSRNQPGQYKFSAAEELWAAKTAWKKKGQASQKRRNGEIWEEYQNQKAHSPDSSARVLYGVVLRVGSWTCWPQFDV